MRRLGGRVSWTAVAAVIVAAAVSGTFLAWLGTGGGGEVGVSAEPVLGAADIQSLEIGTPRDDVEGRLGAGYDALEFDLFTPSGTRAAVEPMDATCVYYQAAGAARGPVQLCYRDDELVSKRIYP